MSSNAPNSVMARPGPHTAPRPGSARLAAALTGHALVSFLRTPAATFFTLIFPVAFLVIVGAMVGGQEVSEGVRVSQYLVAPFLVFGVAEGAFCILAVDVATLRDNGVFQRLRASPAPLWTVLVARGAAAAVSAFLSAVILVTVGVLAYDVRVVWEKLPAALLTVVAGIACCAALGLAIVALTRTVLAAQALTNGVLIPLAFISNVFMVGVNLPAPLDWIGRALPLRHFADAMSATFDPLAAGNGVRWGDLAMLAAWTVAGAVAAVWRFGWEPRGSVRTRRPAAPDDETGPAPTVPVLSAARVAGRPSLARVLAAQVGHDLTGMGRERLPVFFAVVFPALLLLLFPAVIPIETVNGVAFADTVLAGMIAYGIAVAGYVNLPESLARARAGGVLNRMWATPVSTLRYLLGRLLGTLTVAAAITALLVSVAAAANGYRPDPLRIPALVLAVVFSTACFGLLGIALLTAMPSARSVTAVTLGTLVPLSFVSDVFSIGAEVPELLHRIGAFFPLQPAVGLFTAALRPDGVGSGVAWADLAVVAAWALVSGVAAMRIRSAGGT